MSSLHRHIGMSKPSSERDDNIAWQAPPLPPNPFAAGTKVPLDPAALSAEELRIQRKREAALARVSAACLRRCPKNRWSWAEIDLSALRHNIQAFRQRLPQNVQLMAVVKADAYGHGSAKVAPLFAASGAAQFAVATVEEGIKLRKEGITKPILLLSEPPQESVPALLEHDLMPAVFSSKFALAYGECAASVNKVGTYHLAIDTGMTRTGLLPEEVCEFRRLLSFHRGLICAGTFTHFATADEANSWDFQRQNERFAQALYALHEAGFDPGLIHCNNTPATLCSPQTSYDMCRVGIGLYGLHSSALTKDLIDLRPAMSVRARVSRVIRPNVGEGVSYGMEYRVAKNNIQIATIPLGYADGLPRLLSGVMDVLVDGFRCRQVGRICMDQCMFEVDVNPRRMVRPTTEVSYGDLVTIMGSDGVNCISADDLAQLSGTINYEVICDFGLRLTKIYL